MFSSSNGSKKPVQQVSVWYLTSQERITLIIATFRIGDGSGWLVLAPQEASLKDLGTRDYCHIWV